MKRLLSITLHAAQKLIYDGGLSNASNIAMSLLLAIFPFLMLVEMALRAYGTPELTDQVLDLVLGHWPQAAASDIDVQIKAILSSQTTSLFSFSTLIVLALASNGVESARDGLNRAYRLVETRAFWWRRLQGALVVIIGAFGLILTAFILVGTPLMWRFLVGELAWLQPFSATISLVQYAVAVSILLLGLYAFHRFLPDGKMNARSIIWGILLSMFSIILGSKLFAFYLQTMANYTALYAGLAGTMIAIVYLYGISTILLFGAEFNAALAEERAAETVLASADKTVD